MRLKLLLAVLPLIVTVKSDSEAVEQLSSRAAKLDDHVVRPFHVLPRPIPKPTLVQTLSPEPPVTEKPKPLLIVVPTAAPSVKPELSRPKFPPTRPIPRPLHVGPVIDPAPPTKDVVEPNKDPLTRPLPKPIPRPLLRPAPQPLPTPQPQPQPEPQPQPQPETERPIYVRPAPNPPRPLQPLPQLVPEQKPEPLPEPTPEPKAEPLPEPKPQPIPNPTTLYEPEQTPLIFVRPTQRPLIPQPVTLKPQPQPFPRPPAPQPTPLQPAPKPVVTPKPYNPGKLIPNPNLMGDTGIAVEYNCVQDGFYSVVNECDAYIECHKRSALKYICKDGLIFDKHARWPEFPCAYPSEDMQCEVGAAIHEPQPTSECPRQYGYFAIKDSDCSRYISCQEGLATIMNCPPGLVFNDKKSACDWPENVPNCNLSVFQGFSCPPTPVDEYGEPYDWMYKYRFGKSCKQYIACQRGHPRLLSCDLGLAFDEVSETCVEADYVSNCSQG